MDEHTHQEVGDIGGTDQENPSKGRYRDNALEDKEIGGGEVIGQFDGEGQRIGLEEMNAQFVVLDLYEEPTVLSKGVGIGAFDVTSNDDAPESTAEGWG